MKELTGTFPREDIGTLQVPRPPAGVIEALSALDGVTSLVSDALGESGLSGTIAGSVLKPVLPGKRIVGPALTLLKRPVRQGVERPRPRGDLEAHNLTTPGDILVIQGLDEVSNMGGISAMTSKRQGCLGAIIWGGCRDVAELRDMDYPVWSRSVTPLTGVGRIDGVFLNGDIHLGAVAVSCGDIIVADDDGVCVIPRHAAVAVTEQAVAKAAKDTARARAIASGKNIFKAAGAR